MAKVICGVIASYKLKMLVLKSYNTSKIENSSPDIVILIPT